MTDTNMPVTEAVVASTEREPLTYELAYHVLPTVAEGEVAAVSDTVKQYITSHSGTIFDEEVAARFELAYEIEKYLDGKYRRFSSAYFGWIRFKAEPTVVAAISAEVDSNKHILRHLLIKLTKVEEVNPFRFHEAIKDTKITTINLDAEAEIDEAIDEVSEDEIIDTTTADTDTSAAVKA